MTPIIPHRKEKPLTSLVGLGGGATGMANAGLAEESKYIDEVFSTYPYKGTQGPNTANTGLDMTKDGMVWYKCRTANNTQYILTDTVRGANKVLRSDDNSAESNETGLNQTFTNTGWTLNNGFTDANNGSNDYTSWNFRKQKGFFDIVSYSGDGVTGRTISHGLGCVPGLIIIKSTTDATSWFTYHRGLGATKYVMLNHNNAEATQSWFMNDTTPTSTQFTLGSSTNVNGSGRDYIAYIFAGGESTAATARSVDFDGSNDYLSIADHADFDVGTNWTAECWFKCDQIMGNGWDAIFGQWSGGYVLEYVGTDLRFYYPASYQSLGPVPLGQWHHVAISKEGSTTRIFLNGTQVVADFDMGTTSSSNVFNIGGSIAGGGWFNGKISNVRIVQGTAVYTSSFIPPTEPLTNITNTKLLCCNDSSQTGSTVTPGTITNHGSTASTDSPFDDPEGFKFGENEDQNLIKTGSYIGNGSTNNKINVGWEPQWILIKNVTDNSYNWYVSDMMRGLVDDGTSSDDKVLLVNNTDSEKNWNRIALTSRGFKLSDNDVGWNGDGKSYIYIAIRRPDGYVGKPAEAGTDAFNVVYGNSSSTIPNFPSNFIVGMGIYKEPANTYNWYLHTRLMGGKSLKTDSDAVQSTGSDADATFDSNAGWGKFGYNTDKASWMWKRGAGFDVVTYTGEGATLNSYAHSLNKIPEMMWVKRRDGTNPWSVYHKGLNGGSNPEGYGIQLNTTAAEVASTSRWANTAPTSTNFFAGANTGTNNNASTYLAMLFASVEGISKVGWYTGTGQSLTITTGFSPRFLLLKNASSSDNWRLLDTLRGWGAGNDCQVRFSQDSAQGCSEDWGAPTSTGFTLTASTDTAYNRVNNNFIYYAHA